MLSRLVALSVLLAAQCTLLCVDARQIKVSVPRDMLKKPSTGRISVMFARDGKDPLDDTDVTGSNLFYGQNVFDFKGGDTVVLEGGNDERVDTDLYGHPYLQLNDIPAGDYKVQAFLTLYEKVTRSDGSTVQVRFPCGDGAPNVNAPGSLVSDVRDVTIGDEAATIELALTSVTPKPDDLDGKEIGGCEQGNYKDTDTLKYVKIRSRVLSDFWRRDMYVGANVLLPAGYNPSDKKTRYPVIYDQGHWPGKNGPYGYGRSASFTSGWNAGTAPATSSAPARPAPKFILITFRHESPFYDDSYGVNTANIGPWGDALNDELIPHLDKHFNTIAQPYARITDGGSTGGWISFASAIFRPDVFGATFSYYPDSLSFQKHQDIELYTAKNAYTRDDGSKVGSIRTFNDAGEEEILATVEQENHWELTFGTRTRSQLQWDVWNAVFGIQGVNGYALEPWNKVTGVVDRKAVDAWRPMDLTEYLTANWRSKRQLGKHLRGRLHVSVGEQDDYYLNEGVKKFQERVRQLSGGDTWAEVTFIPDKGHGGNYKNTDIWTYLDTVAAWVADHAPNGKTPLSREATSKHLRGNIASDVMRHGGHKAARARQSDPTIRRNRSSKHGSVVGASGTWDSAVTLAGQWIVNGKPDGVTFAVEQGKEYRKSVSQKSAQVAFAVTGTKLGYAKETRKSKTVHV